MSWDARAAVREHVGAMSRATDVHGALRERYRRFLAAPPLRIVVRVVVADESIDRRGRLLCTLVDYHLECGHVVGSVVRPDAIPLTTRPCARCFRLEEPEQGELF